MASLAGEFNVGRSTIHGIVKNEAKLRQDQEVASRKEGLSEELISKSYTKLCLPLVCSAGMQR